MMSTIASLQTWVPGALTPSVVMSLGLGLALVPATIVAVQGVPRALSGLASGVLNTSRFIGAALGLAVLATVVVPWYAYAAWRTGGSSLREFVLRDNVGRYLAPMQHHAGPIWIYIPALFVAFLPWSVFLPGALRAPNHGEAFRLILLWAAIPLVFFSLAATKLPHYLLPIFPALALAIGWLLTRTAFGRIIRAAADNREMAEALGVDMRWVYARVFTLGTMLCAAAPAMINAGPFGCCWKVSSLLLS